MKNRIYDMLWDDVLARVRLAMPRTGTIFGVPRGGAVVAGLMKAMNPDLVVVTDAALASVIVDDIIDSGATLDRYTQFSTRFVALVDKRGHDREMGWVRFPWEETDITKDIEETVVRQLQMIGEDPTREGLRETPKRYLKAFREMTAGLQADPKAPLSKLFDEDHDEIVIVRGIEFTSLCEHHLLPFTGTVDFAYLPQGKVVGLSKIPRFIEILSRRPQVQERLTSQIADVFTEVVNPRGVMVVVKGSHSCMRLRGARSTGEMVTSVVRGAFKDTPEARSEVLALITGRTGA